MKTFFSILFSIFLCSIPKTEACEIGDDTYKNFISKIVNVEMKDVQIHHAVAGYVKILDGCSFSVRNMTIIPTGNSVYWYGIPIQNSSDPVPRIVSAALGSYNGQFITFHLDPTYSFSQFSIIEIRSEGDSRAYGAFNLSGNIEQYYNLRKNPSIDIDVTKPFSAAASVFSSWKSNIRCLFLPYLIIVFLYFI